MDYTLVKSIHLATVVITFALFVLRGLWMMVESRMLRVKWVRVLPHVNDTLLLLSGLTLAALSGQYPIIDNWLTAKLLALLVYIGLGMLALKPGRRRDARIAAWLGALAVFGYMVAVAVTRSALPWS
jgi:uncharacterized membrane protein SirB2